MVAPQRPKFCTSKALTTIGLIMQRRQAVVVLCALTLLGASATVAGTSLAASHAAPSAIFSTITLPNGVIGTIVPAPLISDESSTLKPESDGTEDPLPDGESGAIQGEDAAAGTTPLEAGTPDVEGTTVESANAAIAIALRDRAAIVVATSTHAIRTTPEEAYGDEGLLAGSGSSPGPSSPSTDSLWLVGITGDIHNSFGAVAVPLDWMIVVIDARTGSILSTSGNTGTLPDIFG